MKVHGANNYFKQIREELGRERVMRRDAERASRENEARYRRLLDTANEGIWMIDAEGRTEYVNERMAALLGYSIEEMLGRPMYDFMDDEARREAASNFERRKKGVAERHNFRLRRKDNSDLWTLMSTNPINDDDGNFVGALAMVTNLTDFQRAENALREKQASLNLLIKQMPAIVWTTDAKLRLTSLQGAALDDINVKPDQYVGMTLEEYFAANDFGGEIIRAHEKALEGESAFYERERDDRIFECRVEPLFNADERISGCIGAAFDITERRREETENLRMANHIRLLMESTGEGIFGIDLDGKCTFINRAAANEFGYKPEEIMGRDMHRLIHQNHGDDSGYQFEKCPIFFNLREFSADDCRRNEDVFRRSDGSGFPAEYSCYPVTEAGKMTGIVVIFCDITARKKAQEALRRSEQNYEELVNSIDGIVWEADAETFQFTFISKQAERLLGYPVERWLAEPNFWKEHLHALDRQWAVDFCARATEEKRPHEFEYRIIAADGRTIWLRDIVTVVVENNRPAKLRGVMVDITDRKQTEESLQYRLRFEAHITKISTSFINLPLKDINEGINRALETVGEFVGADRSYIFRFSEDGLAMDNTEEWCAPGVEPQVDNLKNLPTGDFKWILEQIRALKTVYIPRVDALPPEAASEKKHFEPQGIKSLVLVPMIYDGAAIGFLGFDSVQTERAWSEDSISLLRILGGIFVNALERQRAEEALRDSEERYRTLAENGGVGIWQATPEGDTIYVNPAMQRMLEIESSNEIKGVNGCEFFTEESRITIKRERAKRRRGMASSYEAELIGKCGGKRNVVIYGAPILKSDGSLHSLIGTVTDITELKRAEDELRRNNNLLQAVIEGTTDAVYVKDLEGRHLLVNSACAAVIGRPVEEVINRSCYEFFPPETARHIDETDKRVIAAGKTQTFEETVMIAGSERTFHSTKGVYRNAQGEIIGLIGISRDITERKRAEAELKTSEAEMRALFAAMTDVILVVDAEGHYLKVAPTQTKLLYQPPAEIVGKTVRELFPPDKADFFINSTKRALAVGEPINIEYSLPINDEKKWFNATISPMREDAVVFVARDITAHKRAEDRLREANQTFEALVKASPEAIVIVDLKGIVTMWNPAATRIFGWTAEEAIGEFHPIIPDDKRDEFYKIQQSVLEGKVFTAYETRRRKKGNLPIDVSLSVAALRDAEGQVSGVMAVITDITERKRADDERRKQLAAIEASMDGIALLDNNGEFIYLNQAHAEIYGYEKREELIGKSWQILYEPEEVQRIIREAEPFFTKNGQWRGESTGLRRDGSRFPQEISLNSLGADGRLCIVRDITERKHAEEHIRNSLREKEVLLQEVHHRVKNNLQVISSLLNLQSKYVEDEKALELFKESENRVRSMSLIHEKLYQSKHLSRVNFDEYINALISDLIVTYGVNLKKISVKVNVENVFLSIGKAIPCGLIINELISNSLKYAFPDARRGEIAVELRSCGEHNLLIVRDDGVGLPPGTNPAESETLGLKLVNGLTRQLAGQITLDDSNGTKFEILFPNDSSEDKTDG